MPSSSVLTVGPLVGVVGGQRLGRAAAQVDVRGFPRNTEHPLAKATKAKRANEPRAVRAANFMLYRLHECRARARARFFGRFGEKALGHSARTFGDSRCTTWLKSSPWRRAAVPPAGSPSRHPQFSRDRADPRRRPCTSRERGADAVHPRRLILANTPFACLFGAQTGDGRSRRPRSTLCNFARRVEAASKRRPHHQRRTDGSANQANQCERGRVARVHRARGSVHQRMLEHLVVGRPVRLMREPARMPRWSRLFRDHAPPFLGVQREPVHVGVRFGFGLPATGGELLRRVHQRPVLPHVPDGRGLVPLQSGMLHLRQQHGPRESLHAIAPGSPLVRITRPGHEPVEPGAASHTPVTASTFFPR